VTKRSLDRHHGLWVTYETEESMFTRAIVVLVLAAVAIGLGCSDSDREPVEGAMVSAERGPAQSGTPASNRFLTEARMTVDELSSQVHALGLQYVDAAGSTADTWDATQRSVMEAQRRVQEDLTRAAAAGSEALEDAQVDIVDGIQAFTERVDQARLGAVEGGREFVAASEMELMAIDDRIESLQDRAAQLSDEVREEAASDVESLRAKADEIGARLALLYDATEEEIAGTRAELTKSIASLSGSVQRERLEIVGAGA